MLNYRFNSDILHLQLCNARLFLAAQPDRAYEWYGSREDAKPYHVLAFQDYVAFTHSRTKPRVFHLFW